MDDFSSNSNNALLLKKINGEIEDFKSKPIQRVPGLWFNQYDTINRIYFAWNSKFVTGEIDLDGDRKYYYNISVNPCKVFSKAIDFDTKNIRLLTVGGGNPTKTWFMERDLKYWMRDKQFGKILNRTFKELPIFGTVVLKIIDGYPYFVDLRNFVLDQAADNLDSATYIIEIHNFTVDQFRKAAKSMGWAQDKVDEAIRQFHQMKGATKIRVYERYGEVEEIKNGKTVYSNRKIYHADVGVDQYDNYGNLTIAKSGVLLSSVEYDGHPYWEFHAEKLPGRWLGYGVVERLFEPQIRVNELSNLQSKASYYLSLHLFQSRDPKVAGNLIQEKRSGDVTIADSEITEINISDRNQVFFNQEHAKWMNNRDEMSFSYDAVQGDRAPASTPLGETKINVAQTLSYFEQIQEDIAMDFKEMLYEVIIPRFEKENSKEHVLRLVGNDLEQYTEMVKNELVLKEVIRQTSRTGRLPTQEEKEVIEVAMVESIKQGKEKLLPIPSSFYDGVKYDVDIDITGESVDTRVRYATRFAILQALQSDPTMTTDPVKRKILSGIAEDGGINPSDFFEVQQKPIANMVPQVQNGRGGGGVSAPALGSPLAGAAAATI